MKSIDWKSIRLKTNRYFWPESNDLLELSSLEQLKDVTASHQKLSLKFNASAEQNVKLEPKMT